MVVSEGIGRACVALRPGSHFGEQVCAVGAGVPQVDDVVERLAPSRMALLGLRPHLHFGVGVVGVAGQAIPHAVASGRFFDELPQQGFGVVDVAKEEVERPGVGEPLDVAGPGDGDGFARPAHPDQCDRAFRLDPRRRWIELQRTLRERLGGAERLCTLQGAGACGEQGFGGSVCEVELLALLGRELAIAGLDESLDPGVVGLAELGQSIAMLFPATRQPLGFRGMFEKRPIPGPTLEATFDHAPRPGAPTPGQGGPHLQGVGFLGDGCLVGVGR